jgi:hypothetical protein
MVAIDLSGNGLDRATKLLSGIGTNTDGVMKKTISGLRGHLEKTAQEEIIKVWYFGTDSIKKYSSTVSSYWDKTLTVTFLGKRVPLLRYKVEPQVMHTTSRTPPVRYAMRRDHAMEKLERGFIGIMKNNNRVVMERLKDTRYPIKNRPGLAVSQMLGDEGVTEEIYEQMTIEFEKRLDADVTRILNGWM